MPDTAPRDLEAMLAGFRQDVEGPAAPLKSPEDGLEGMLEAFKADMDQIRKVPPLDPTSPDFLRTQRRGPDQTNTTQAQPDATFTRGSVTGQQGPMFTERKRNDELTAPVKQAFNQSITGMAYELAFGEKAFDMTGYEPNAVEQIASEVISFIMPVDAALLAAGGGLAGKAFQKAATTYGPRIVQKLVASGVSQRVAERAVSKGLQIAGAAAKSGAGLGTYGAAASAGAQKTQQGYVDLVQVSKDALRSGALGVILGATGAATAGLPQPVPIAAEIGAFTVAGAGLEGRAPDLDDFSHATALVIGLKLQHLAVAGTKKTFKKAAAAEGALTPELVNRVGNLVWDQYRQIMETGAEDPQKALREAVDQVLAMPVEEITGQKPAAETAAQPEQAPTKPKTPAPEPAAGQTTAVVTEEAPVAEIPAKKEAENAPSREGDTGRPEGKGVVGRPDRGVDPEAAPVPDQRPERAEDVPRGSGAGVQEGVRPGDRQAPEGGAAAEAVAEQPAQQFKAGSTQANIPADSDAGKAVKIARDLVDDADLMGDGKNIGADHVTVRWGIKGEDFEEVKRFLQEQAPFEVTLGKTEKFDPSESSDHAAVIKAPAESPELRRINEEIQQHAEFEESAHGEYQPHATIAYVKPEAAEKYIGLDATEGQRFTVSEIAISKKDGTVELVKLQGTGKPVDETALSTDIVDKESIADVRTEPQTDSEPPPEGGSQQRDAGIPAGGDPQGRGTARTDTGQQRPPSRDRGAADEDVPAAEPAAGADLRDDRVPGQPGDVERQPAADAAGEAVSRDRDNAVVPTAARSDREPERAASLDNHNLDLRGKEPVVLTKGARKAINDRAREILSEKSEGFTDAEKDILRQYTGEGGLHTGADYTLEALNQHFTDYQTIRQIWTAIEGSGFKPKTALEPAVGAGSFVGHRPELDWTTIDIDATNHKVVKALYPGAAHYNVSYEEFTGKDFDLVISNVPFAEERGALRNKVLPKVKTLHDFYFLHSLDRVREDGVIGFITSKFTMDKLDSRYRAELVQQADVIGAFRLPAGHFGKTAHTDVTTDVIFLHKRPAGAEPTAEQRRMNDLWVKASKTEHGIALSEYYQRNPDFMLGDVELGKDKLYGQPAYIVKGPAKFDKLQFTYRPYRAAKTEQVAGTAKGVPNKWPEFLSWADESKAVWAEKDDADFGRNLIVTPDHTVLVAHDLVDMADVRKVVKLYRPITGADADKVQRLDQIARLADEFQATGNYDLASQAMDLIRDYQVEYQKHPAKDAKFRKFLNDLDESSYLHQLSSLFDEKFEPAEVFRIQTRFTGSGRQKATADSPLADRAFASENHRGEISIEAEAEGAILKVEEAKALAERQYAITDWNPDRVKLQNKVLYYSGNVYERIDQARKMIDFMQTMRKGSDLVPLLEKQIERLEAIRPERKGIDDIRIGGTEQWLYEVLETYAKLPYERKIDEKTGRYKYTLKPPYPVGSSGSYKETVRIIQNHLNNRQLVERLEDESSLEYERKLREAQDVVQEWLDKQKDTWRRNTDLSAAVEEKYNRLFRNYVRPNYEQAQYLIQDVLDELAVNLKDHPIVKGLYRHQISWVVQSVYEGKGINGHDVGAGKTISAITLGRVLKKRGIAQKPLYVVPGKTIHNWQRWMETLFPGAKVVNLGKLPATHRNKDLFKLANSEADFVIASHEGFEHIKLDPERENTYIDLVAAEGLDDPGLQGRKAALLQQKIEQVKDLIKQEKRDPRLTFERLGVDAIIVDEAHNFKNLGVRSKLVDAKLGISFAVNETGTALKSNRSYDLRFKANYISDSNNGNNVFLLTATPTPNKPMEVYHLMRHMSTSLFHEYGIHSDQAFADQFYEVGDVMTSAGDSKRVLKAIVHAQELRGILNRYIDKLSTEQMPWVTVPKAVQQEHFLSMPDEWRLIREDLQRREREKPRRGAKGDDTTVAIYTSGRNASADPRLYASAHAEVVIDTRAFDKERDKMEYLITHAVKRAQEDKDAGQLIFLDNNGKGLVEKGQLPQDLHSELKRELIKAGFDKKEIAIINGQAVTNPETGADTASGDKDLKKQEIADLYNAGKIRFVIGTTQSMGEGMDLQVRTRDIWHVDIPYTPGAIRQRNGRGVRQGNRNKTVDVHVLMMRGTFDSLSYGIVAHKKGWNEALWDKDVADRISTEEEMAEGAIPRKEQILIELEEHPYYREKLTRQFEHNILLDNQQANRASLNAIRRKLARVKDDLDLNEGYLADREERLPELKPNEKIKDPEERQQQFEKSKRHLEEMIEASKRRIDDLTRRQERGLKQLAELTGDQATLEGKLKRFESQYVHPETGEIYPGDSWLEENPQYREELKADVDATRQQREAIARDRKRREESGGSDYYAAPGEEPGELATLRTRGTESLTKRMEPNPTGKTPAIGTQDVVNFASKTFDVPIRSGHLRGKPLGLYKQLPRAIRQKDIGDITVTTHEVAHHIEETTPGLRAFVLRNRRLFSPLDYMDNRRNAREGFAEYMRMWLTRAADVEQMYPRIAQSLRDYLVDFPKLEGDLARFREVIDSWRSQGAMKRIEGQMELKKTMGPVREIGRRFLHKMEAAFVDDLFPLERAEKLVREVKQLDPRQINPESSPTMIARAFAKSEEHQARDMILNGTFDMSGNRTGESLRDVLSPVRKDIGDFLVYAYAKRAVELHGRQINPGIDLGDAEWTVDYIESRPDGATFKTALKGLVDFQDRVTDYVVESGALSREAADAMRLLNSWYIPLKRVFETETGSTRAGRRFGDLPTPIKKIRGSSRAIKNPLESIIQQTAFMLGIANKTRVGRALVELAEANPGSGWFAEKLPAPVEKHGTSIETLKNQLEAAGVDLAEADLHQIVTFWQNSGRYSPGAMQNKDNVLTVFRNGEREWWQIDGELYESLKGVNAVSMGPLTRILSMPARGVRLGATSLDAGFALVTNPLRDLQTFTMQTEYGRGNLGESVYRAGKGVVRRFRGARRFEADRFYSHWRRIGGDLSNILGQDRSDINRAIHEVLASSRGEKLRQEIKHPIEVLKDVFSFTEAGPRLAEFESAYKQGEQLYGRNSLGAQIMGKMGSSESTVDFRRSGQIGWIVNQVIPFFNVAIQGPARMTRFARAHPLKFAVRALAWQTIPSLALWWFNRDEQWYKELPTWRKYGFFNFRVGTHDDGTPLVWSVPRAFEWGWLFGAVPEMAANYWYDQDKAAMLEGVGSSASLFIPELYPTAMKVPFELQANYNEFRDRPIDPHWEVEYKEPWERTSPWTTETAKTIGETFNWSPRKIEHFISGYSGGLGMDVIRAVEHGVGLAQGESLQGEFSHPADIPVLGRLAHRVPPPDQRKKQLDYEREQTKGRWKRLRRAGDEAKAEELRQTWNQRHPDFRI